MLRTTNVYVDAERTVESGHPENPIYPIGPASRSTATFSRLFPRNRLASGTTVTQRGVKVERTKFDGPLLFQIFDMSPPEFPETRNQNEYRTFRHTEKISGNGIKRKPLSCVRWNSIELFDENWQMYVREHFTVFNDRKLASVNMASHLREKSTNRC